MKHILFKSMMVLLWLYSFDSRGQTSVQNAQTKYIDLSINALLSVGGSSLDDESLSFLQAGGHDPKRSGFNLQSVEVSLTGAVDHYFTAETHILFGLSKEGESFLELEEAFFKTLSMPGGLELKGGQFLTQIGRSNPYHVHAWNWQDQPIINSRVLGADGMRGLGAQLAWLLPVSWYSQVYFSAQNATGATMISFAGAQESAVGSQDLVDRDVNGLTELVFALRWVNGWDFSETTASRLGFSLLTGPNSAGANTFTQVYGVDYVLKWVPLNAKRGWPFLTWESEFLLRNYHVDPGLNQSNLGMIDSTILNFGGTLSDWGYYSQVLYGFRPRWAAGVRFEYASGSESSVGFRDFDPFRDNRIRVSPMLAFYPSEFSRVRLQYNYDQATHLEEMYAHSLWLGIEFLFGAHPAHDF
ncbi:MAG TPA: hypothetical protein PKC21_07890 [Oligoflexia bacterium]|nr:hypothetical protein [Oligoflexia bacterium]HMR25258.1 hypothetical protein [Oligoflexia bacterium]